MKNFVTSVDQRITSMESKVDDSITKTDSALSKINVDIPEEKLARMEKVTDKLTSCDAPNNKGNSEWQTRCQKITLSMNFHREN